MEYIDKVAWLFIEDKKLLAARSKGKEAFYCPGGKREGVESNEEVLVREVKEELSVNILPDSIKFYGSFEAQAHGKPLGTIVRITCYFADFSGLLKPSNEIEEIGWLTSKDIGTERTSQVDYLLLKRLFKDELID